MPSLISDGITTCSTKTGHKQELTHYPPTRRPKTSQSCVRPIQNRTRNEPYENRFLSKICPSITWRRAGGSRTEAAPPRLAASSYSSVLPHQVRSRQNQKIRHGALGDTHVCKLSSRLCARLCKAEGCASVSTVRAAKRLATSPGAPAPAPSSSTLRPANTSRPFLI